VKKSLETDPGGATTCNTRSGGELPKPVVGEKRHNLQGDATYLPIEEERRKSGVFRVMERPGGGKAVEQDREEET